MIGLCPFGVGAFVVVFKSLRSITMATQNFGTGVYISAQLRLVEGKKDSGTPIVSDRQATPNLRVTRAIAIKNQPIGGFNEDGTPRTKTMGFRIDFKNLSDGQVALLTVGSLINFEGELMEERFQAGDDFISYNVIESWDFHRVAASKAERTANRPPVAAAPLKREMVTAIATAPADVAEPASYSDIPF
jgi:hypothetical protein